MLVVLRHPRQHAVGGVAQAQRIDAEIQVPRDERHRFHAEAPDLGHWHNRTTIVPDMRALQGPRGRRTRARPARPQGRVGDDRARRAATAAASRAAASRAGWADRRSDTAGRRVGDRDRRQLHEPTVAQGVRGQDLARQREPQVLLGRLQHEARVVEHRHGRHVGAHAGGGEPRSFQSSASPSSGSRASASGCAPSSRRAAEGEPTTMIGGCRTAARTRVPATARCPGELAA